MNLRLSLVVLMASTSAFLGAANSVVLRKSKIDDLFEDEVLANYFLNFMNILAVAPELIYNAKHNAKLRDLWYKISLEAEGFTLPPLKKIVSAIAILATAIPPTIAHFVLFSDANQEMFQQQHEMLNCQKVMLKHGNSTELTEFILPEGTLAVSYLFAAAGSLQHYFHGAMQLAEGAVKSPSEPLFCSSDPSTGNTLSDWIGWLVKNLMYDVGVNGLLLLSVLAEFLLFYQEFSKEVTYNSERLTEVNTSFLNLASITLSLMSACMYLGHEGQSFLKIKKALQKEIRHISEGHYQDLSLEELLQKQMYLLSCLCHAIVHSLVRYEALVSLGATNLLLVPSVAVSGLSRLAMLCIREEHDEHAGPVIQPTSLQYDMHQRGQDVIDEIFFIGTVGVASLFYNETDFIDSNTFMILNVIPPLLRETGLSIVACLWDTGHHFDKMPFIIDAVTTSYLSVRLMTGNEAIYADELMDVSGSVIVASLFLKHFQKKLLSYSEVSDLYHWLETKASDLFRYFTQALARRADALREPVSRCEQVTNYFSNCARSLRSWCPSFFASRQTVANPPVLQRPAQQTYGSFQN